MGDEVEGGRGVLEATDNPTAVFGFEPVLVRQDPFGPHARILTIGAELTNGLAREIGRFGDAALGVDENARVPEHAVREDRQRHELQAGLQQTQVKREPEFADVELVSPEQPAEDLRHGCPGRHRTC